MLKNGCNRNKSIILNIIRAYSKEDRILQKLLTKGSKKRNVWRDFDSVPGASLLPAAAAISRGPQSNKRVAVLNKLFMKHITDLMASGNCAHLVCGLGIEVTKVKVASEFNFVNVYWVCHGKEEVEEVKNRLQRVAGLLREELTGLRVVGRVPHIQFIQDRTTVSWSAVEAILASADFGEDYIPRGVANQKTEFGNDVPQYFPPNTVENEEKVAMEADLPPMRQNVLGLDRASILDRLLISMKGRPTKKVELFDSAGTHMPFEQFNEEAFGKLLLTRKIERDCLAKYGNERLDDSQYIQDEQLDSDSLTDDDDFLEDYDNDDNDHR